MSSRVVNFPTVKLNASNHAKFIDQTFIYQGTSATNESAMQQKYM
jgi:hypothetical protein